jgi:glycosyltransferase involved in cell wall biosynthesis
LENKEMRDNIKVLYYTDPVAFQIFGGAEIQMLKTKQHLEALNNRVSIKFFNPFEDKLDDYDILHIFSMRPDSLSIAKLAKSRGLKVVVSTIYWPERREEWNFMSIKQMLRKFGVFCLNLKDYQYPSFKILYPFKDFLEIADVVAPTSKLEANLLSRKFNINLSKFYPVPVGVDKKFANATPDTFVEKFGLKDFVLFLGRIEKTKNVLTLFEACKDLEIPLVVIGHYNLWERNYFIKCKEIIDKNPNIHYLGFFSSNSAELISAYAAAKVFVLPSLHEVTSLTVLEAGLAGCNVIVTKNTYEIEYLKNLAMYVNPASVTDIKNKILKAYERPKTDKLKQYILNNYCWEHTAEKTMHAYDLALN